MAQFGPDDTHWLTRASFELTAGRRRVLGRGLLLAGLLLALAAVMAGRSGLLGEQLAATTRLAEAQREVARLDAELERVNAELALERATRQELQRQADELGARATELSQQMEFVNSRRAVARNNQAAP